MLELTRFGRQLLIAKHQQTAAKLHSMTFLVVCAQARADRLMVLTVVNPFIGIVPTRNYLRLARYSLVPSSYLIIIYSNSYTLFCAINIRKHKRNVKQFIVATTRTG